MGVINAAELTAAGGAVRPVSSIVAIGDSILAGGYDGSSFYKRTGWLGGDVRLLGNFAVAGKRSDEVLATQVAQAIATGASHCLVQVGTNDISQSIAETTLRTNLIAIWTTLRQAGIEPIDVALLPNSNAGSAAKAAGDNLWRKLYCRANGIRHVDAWPLLANSDGTGAYASGFAFDSIHPNSVAQKVIAGAVKGLFPFSAPPVLALVDDGTFSSMPNTRSAVENAVSFTDTNADGVPNNFNAVPGGGGGTWSIQAVDSGGFGKWARCAISAGTAVGTNITAQSLVSLGWSIGDRLAVGFRIRVADVTQALLISANFTGISAAAGSDVSVMFSEQMGTNTGDDLFVYHECVIGGGTVLGFQWVGTGTGYFEINRPILVNLTKLGLA